MFLIYVGTGLLANTAWIFVLLVPLALIIRYGVVAREEAYLERKFGDAYRAYKSHVRRWL
jgi:protein-S-isoprenylcysteine O-methyltransferase Ste14